MSFGRSVDGMVMSRAGGGTCRASPLLSRDMKGLPGEQGHFSSTGSQAARSSFINLGKIKLNTASKLTWVLAV